MTCKSIASMKYLPVLAAGSCTCPSSHALQQQHLPALRHLHCSCRLLSEAIEVCAVKSCNDGASVLRRRMLVKQQDPGSVTKFQAKLQGHAKKMGGTFVHYNAQDGVWILKVERF